MTMKLHFSAREMSTYNLMVLTTTTSEEQLEMEHARTENKEGMKGPAITLK